MMDLTMSLVVSLWSMSVMKVKSRSEIIGMDIDSFDFEDFTLSNDTDLSTTMTPQIANDSTANTWLQSVIDSIGIIGLISIGSGIFLCFCCLCVGCFCFLRMMRKRGGSSVYQYYSDIEV